MMQNRINNYFINLLFLFFHFKQFNHFNYLSFCHKWQLKSPQPGPEDGPDLGCIQIFVYLTMLHEIESTKQTNLMYFSFLCSPSPSFTLLERLPHSSVYVWLHCVQNCWHWLHLHIALDRIFYEYLTASHVKKRSSRLHLSSLIKEGRLSANLQVK